MEVFYTLAEFSIALAGFTSVAVVFVHRDQKWMEIDRFRVFNALIFSFGASFMSFLPPLLEEIGIEGINVWKWSSIILLVYTIFFQINIIVRKKRLPEDDLKLIPKSVGPVLGITILGVMIVQVLNILWYFNPGFFMTGILMLLFLASFSFFHLIFARPSETN